MVREKDSEARRSEIIIAARLLFVQKGYDQTSVTDILNIVSIAKGTFYYYFASKADLLEAIVTDIVDECVNRASDVLRDISIPLEKRIPMAIRAARPNFEGAADIRKVENAKMERCYLKAMLRRMPKVLHSAIDEGIAQGIFKTPYPYECLETILLTGYMISDYDTFGWQPDEHKQKIQAFSYNIERMLGVEEGSITNLKSLFE